MLTDPPLSSMRVPKIELGVESLRLILELLKNKTARPRKILVPVELIERQSVDRLN
jgi:LacI family transcriptional regulator